MKERAPVLQLKRELRGKEACYSGAELVFNFAMASRSGLTLGFKPYSPMRLCGILMLPPMSVPNPKREPRSAKSAASPPVEPPGVSAGSRGLVVRPQRGFSVSAHY